MVGSKCRDFKNREVNNVNAPYITKFYLIIIAIYNQSLLYFSHQTVATAVTQIYFWESGGWNKKYCGVTCFVKDNDKRSYFIRMFDVHVSIPRVFLITLHTLSILQKWSLWRLISYWIKHLWMCLCMFIDTFSLLLCMYLSIKA